MGVAPPNRAAPVEAFGNALPAAAQKWITTTHLGWLDGSQGLAGLARFPVKAGQIVPGSSS